VCGSNWLFTCKTVSLHKLIGRRRNSVYFEARPQWQFLLRHSGCRNESTSLDHPKLTRPGWERSILYYNYIHEWIANGWICERGGGVGKRLALDGQPALMPSHAWRGVRISRSVHSECLLFIHSTYWLTDAASAERRAEDYLCFNNRWPSFLFPSLLTFIGAILLETRFLENVRELFYVCIKKFQWCDRKICTCMREKRPMGCGCKLFTVEFRMWVAPVFREKISLTYS
jgi:hypothetical protein